MNGRRTLRVHVGPASHRRTATYRATVIAVQTDSIGWRNLMWAYKSARREGASPYIARRLIAFSLQAVVGAGR